MQNVIYCDYVEIENGEIVSGDSEHKKIEVQLHGDSRVTAVFEKK